MIKIDDNYRIENDAYGCTLVYSKKGTKVVDGIEKETTSTERWHYLNVEQCLKRYLDLVIEPSLDVVQVLAAIDSAKVLIRNVLKDLNGMLTKNGSDESK